MTEAIEYLNKAKEQFGGLRARALEKIEDARTIIEWARDGPPNATVSKRGRGAAAAHQGRPSQKIACLQKMADDAEKNGKTIRQMGQTTLEKARHGAEGREVTSISGSLPHAGLLSGMVLPLVPPLLRRRRHFLHLILSHLTRTASSVTACFRPQMAQDTALRPESADPHLQRELSAVVLTLIAKANEVTEELAEELRTDRSLRANSAARDCAAEAASLMRKIYNEAGRESAAEVFEDLFFWAEGRIKDDAIKMQQIIAEAEQKAAAEREAAKAEKGTVPGYPAPAAPAFLKEDNGAEVPNALQKSKSQREEMAEKAHAKMRSSRHFARRVVSHAWTQDPNAGKARPRMAASSESSHLEAARYQVHSPALALRA